MPYDANSATRVLISMKTLCFLVLVAISGAAWSDPAECPLQGAWKSDAARTLADIAARDALSSQGKNAVSTDFFGHMIHEWTCTELRAWFDYQTRAEPMPYRIAERTPDSLLIEFPDDPNADLKLTFEGACYKMYLEHKGFNEYFCPVEKL